MKMARVIECTNPLFTVEELEFLSRRNLPSVEDISLVYAWIQNQEEDLVLLCFLVCDILRWRQVSDQKESQVVLLI